MAEHSRSSGVFSRRRVEDVCCRPPARPRRYPVQSSLSGEREMTPRDRPLCRATVGGPLSRPPPQTRIEVCASLVHCKKLAPTASRHSVCSGNDDLAFSPLSLCPPKRVGASLVRDRDAHLANFFFAQPSALFVAAPTTTTAGPLSPPFLQPSKMSVSANYFFVPTICMVGAPTGHYLSLFCNCQKLPTEPNHAYFYRLAGLAPLAL